MQLVNNTEWGKQHFGVRIELLLLTRQWKIWNYRLVFVMSMWVCRNTVYACAAYTVCKLYSHFSFPYNLIFDLRLNIFLCNLLFSYTHRVQKHILCMCSICLWIFVIINERNLVFHKIYKQDFLQNLEPVLGGKIKIKQIIINQNWCYQFYIQHIDNEFIRIETPNRHNDFSIFFFFVDRE